MRNNYGCDLDSLTTGSRIGMMRSSNGDLHYFINGVDQGVACSGLPPVRPSIYYQRLTTCGQQPVTEQCHREVLPNTFPRYAYNVCHSCSSAITSNTCSERTLLEVPPDCSFVLVFIESGSRLVPGIAHRFHSNCGKNVALQNDGCRAVRIHGFSHGVVLSMKELRSDELFEPQYLYGESSRAVVK
eukprot:g44341.t1